MSAKKEPCVNGEALEILTQLLTDGYMYTGKKRNTLRFLQRLFPVIKRAQFKGRSIYYLKDKNKQALLEMMKQDSSRIISYQELAKMTKVFNTSIEMQQKRAFLGKNKTRKSMKTRRIDIQQNQIQQEKQSKIDDVLGRFLHSEVLRSSSSESSY